jgi:molybdopterin converting factor small subunit
MNVNVNFFSWIRDGVKQSVLLGVSDAIETLGTPEDDDQLHPGVAAFLREETTKTGTKRVGSNSNRGRKRLGKSLKDIDETSTS